jgi:hypothetical protein
MTQPTDRPGINDLTSDQLDRLYARLSNAERELARLTDMAIRYSDRAIENGERAEKAEATLTAVRDVLAHWDGSDVAYGHFATRTRAVLDQHGQTPA